MSFFQKKQEHKTEFFLDLHLPCVSEDDEIILYKIIRLTHRLSTFFIKSSAEQDFILNKYEDKMHYKISLMEEAMRLEKTDLLKAISIYEELIAEGYNYTANPYQRLAIIYRNQKKYDEEIRVIKSGLRVLVESGLDSFYAEFIERLEKAVILREHNN